MATAVIVPGVATWVSKGVLQTRWENMSITTTGDVGTPQQTYAGMNVMAVHVSGTLASDTVVQFQQALTATQTFSVAQTVCGTDLQFTSATGAGLQKDVTYLVYPGARHFRPKITAGASSSEDVTVTYIQSRGSLP